MGAFSKRLYVIAVGELAGTISLGLLVHDATMLILGVVTLGVGTVLAILYYLLRPLRCEYGQAVSTERVGDRRGAGAASGGSAAVVARPHATSLRLVVDNTNKVSQ